MSPTRKQILVQAMTRRIRLEKDEAARDLNNAIEANSINKDAFESVETAFQGSIEYAKKIVDKGRELNVHLYLYRLAGDHLAELAEESSQLKMKLDQSENERQLALDALVNISLRLNRVESLAEEEAKKVKQAEQTLAQKTQDEMVVGRYHVTQ